MSKILSYIEKMNAGKTRGHWGGLADIEHLRLKITTYFYVNVCARKKKQAGQTYILEGAELKSYSTSKKCGQNRYDQRVL